MGFLFIIRRLGFLVVDHWKIVVPVIALLFVTVFLYRACNKPPRLDEKAIQAAQTAIAERDRKKMLDVLAESDAKEAQIDANLANAASETVKATTESRKKYADMTTEQLAAELERRAKE